LEGYNENAIYKKMGGIERRTLLKAEAIGGVAWSIGSAVSLLAPNGARAQGTPPPAAPSWPNRRLLDLLKIDHPIIQAPMGVAVSPSMPVAVFGVDPPDFPTSIHPPFNAEMCDVVVELRRKSSAFISGRRRNPWSIASKPRAA
jgi:hypothetical protein